MGFSLLYSLIIGIQYLYKRNKNTKPGLLAPGQVNAIFETELETWEGLNVSFLEFWLRGIDNGPRRGRGW